jgi:hypothetical protein
MLSTVAEIGTAEAFQAALDLSDVVTTASL